MNTFKTGCLQIWPVWASTSFSAITHRSKSQSCSKTDMDFTTRVTYLKLTPQTSVYCSIFGFKIITLTLICVYLCWFFSLKFETIPSWSIGSRLSYSKKYQNKSRHLGNHLKDAIFQGELNRWLGIQWNLSEIIDSSGQIWCFSLVWSWGYRLQGCKWFLKTA